MKYDSEHTPLVCMQSDSACYRGTRPMTVKGVLWHSTGANNPEQRRYIQPADSDPNRKELLNIIGVNRYGNDYNHGSKDRQMGVNAWIGKLADGTVAAVQAQPWGWKPWGCGAGDKGSCNDGFIQFECAEDSLTDPVYAMKVYKEACELTAYLCTMYHIDPHGTVSFKGVNVPTILDHRTSHLLGLGNNHGDIQHWFPKIIGKTQEDIRNDVAALMEGSGTIAIPEEEERLAKGDKGEDVRALQQKLILLGYDLGKWGADGDFGSATEAAVKGFQVNHGITLTGIADQKTLDAIDEAVNALSSDTTYTVVIRGLQRSAADELKAHYPDCEVRRDE